VARYTKHNIEDWDFRDCSLDSPSNDIEAEDFLSENYVTVVATDAARLILIKRLVEHGIVELDDDKRHARFVIEHGDAFLAGMKKGESRFNSEGRFYRSIIEALRRENRKYGRLRVTILPLPLSGGQHAAG
jgi:hypothetical protein